MKKRLLFLNIILAFVSLSASAQSMYVVVKNGKVEGRLVEEKAYTYVISVQDDGEISKDGAHVELWRAKDGRGVVMLENVGLEKVYSQPNENSPMVGVVVSEEGDCPEYYDCLGVVNGFYKIRLKDGRKGYVKASLMYWDAIYTC